MFRFTKVLFKCEILKKVRNFCLFLSVWGTREFIFQFSGVASFFFIILTSFSLIILKLAYHRSHDFPPIQVTTLSVADFVLNVFLFDLFADSFFWWGKCICLGLIWSLTRTLMLLTGLLSFSVSLCNCLVHFVCSQGED